MDNYYKNRENDIMNFEKMKENENEMNNSFMNLLYNLNRSILFIQSIKQNEDNKHKEDSYFPEKDEQTLKLMKEKEEEKKKLEGKKKKETKTEKKTFTMKDLQNINENIESIERCLKKVQTDSEKEALNSYHQELLKNKNEITEYM